jgi:predicted HNH restriction endonuclease
MMTDLSNYPKEEPKELWAQLKPTQKASLRRLAYEMQSGDVIYVKQGPKIVGMGFVKGPYQFDSKFRLITPNNEPWSHQIPVEWASDFPEITLLLGSEQLTVKKLSLEDLKSLELAIDKARESNRQKKALEGETYKKEAVFRSRNRALIQAKKANSDYRCEVCGFNFEATYGEIGHGYIVAHHLKLIASGPSKTTLDEIALVCANCHAMIHKKAEPLPIEELRSLVQRNL